MLSLEVVSGVNTFICKTNNINDIYLFYISLLQDYDNFNEYDWVFSKKYKVSMNY